MARSLWLKTFASALASTGLALGQGPGAVSTPDAGGQTVTVQEVNRAPQRCRLVRSWRTPEGAQAHLLQSLDDGEQITIVETGNSAVDAGNGSRTVSTRIYHWGRNNTPPPGTPIPPTAAGGIASGAGRVPAAVRPAVTVLPQTPVPAPAAPKPVAPPPVVQAPKPAPTPLPAPMTPAALASQTIQAGPGASPAKPSTPAMSLPTMPAPAPAVAAAPAKPLERATIPTLPEAKPLERPVPTPAKPLERTAAVVPTKPLELPTSPTVAKPQAPVASAPTTPPSPVPLGAPTIPSYTTDVPEDKIPKLEERQTRPTAPAAMANAPAPTTPAQESTGWRPGRNLLRGTQAVNRGETMVVPTTPPPLATTPPKAEKRDGFDLPRADTAKPDPFQTPEKYVKPTVVDRASQPKGEGPRFAPVPAAKVEMPTGVQQAKGATVPSLPVPAPTAAPTPAPTTAVAPTAAPAAPVGPPPGSGSVLAAVGSGAGTEVQFMPVPIPTEPDPRQMPRLAPPPQLPRAPQLNSRLPGGRVGAESHPNAFHQPEAVWPPQAFSGPGPSSNAFTVGRQPPAAGGPGPLATGGPAMMAGRMPPPAPFGGAAQFGPPPQALAQMPAQPMPLPPAFVAAQQPRPVAVPAPQTAAKDAPQSLTSMVKDSLYPSQREWAVDRLAIPGAAKDPAVVQTVMQVAKDDPAPAVRAAAVRGLARMGVADPAVLTVLQALKADRDPQVCQEASRALTQLQQPVQPTKAEGR